METSVNNKCKAFSSLEQSKKLAEFLPLESADMYYKAGNETQPTFKLHSYGHIMSNNDVYAWSLTALLNVLPFPQLSKDKLGSGKVGWMVSIYPDNCRYDSCWHDNSIDAAFEMLLKLHELKML